MRVFVSYSSADTSFVDCICQELEIRGVSVWRDVKDIKVGDSIVERIEDGIKHCDYFCLVLSFSSVSRPWVLREYRTALNRQLSTDGKGIWILPIKLDSCEIPELLRDIKYADFSRSFIEGLDSLYQALGVDIKRKIPYSELIKYIESKFDNLSKFLERCKETKLQDFPIEDLSALASLTWESVENSKMELEEYIKSGTNIVTGEIDLLKNLPSDRIGVIISHPLKIDSSYYYDTSTEFVYPELTFQLGLLKLIELLRDNLDDILNRHLFLIPKSCERKGESFPDGYWRDEIDLRDIHEVLKNAQNRV